MIAQTVEITEIMNSKIAHLYMGTAVMDLPTQKLQEIAAQVSNELTCHPYTMLQYPQRQLLENMKKGKTILVASENENLLAFGQIWLYEEKENGDPIYEFGSWLSFAKGGFGTKVLLSAPVLAKLINPNSQIVAIVEEENTKAQGIIQTLGGKRIGLQESSIIKDPLGNFASMEVFDITNLSKKGTIAAHLTQGLGVPEDKVPGYLSALYTALGGPDPVQRAIDYLIFKIGVKKGLGQFSVEEKIFASVLKGGV